MIKPRQYKLRKAHWPEDTALLRQVREAVFVVEQQVPIELEWDDMDAVCEHVIATDKKGTPIGTGRLLPDGHIGRMAVLLPYRGSGIGSAMLKLLLEIAIQRDMPKAILNAQVSAIAFYEKFGFSVRGPEFMEAGIPHREMTLKLKTPS